MVFSKKVNSLFSKEDSENLFVKEGLKVSSECTSTNGAKKYSTSGDDFVDNFASISHFKEPRSYEDISNDMRLLWSQNRLLCLKLAFYIRLITRKSKIVKDKDVYVIKGDAVEKLFRMTNFNTEEAYERFSNKLRRMGIDEELEKMGIQDGDTVRIFDFEFEWTR